MTARAAGHDFFRARPKVLSRSGTCSSRKSRQCDGGGGSTTAMSSRSRKKTGRRDDRPFHPGCTQGSGKLALKLSIPLHANAKSKVAGAYQFAGNTIVIAPDLPTVEQAGGRVEFTESTVRAQNLSGALLGGPVTISATTAGDASVRVNVQGRVNADNARRSAGNPYWAQYLRGATDWHALITARKRTADLVVESSLQGLAADLPAPLSKSASDTLPFRFERRLLGGQAGNVSSRSRDLNLLRESGYPRHHTHGAFDSRTGGRADRAGLWGAGSVSARCRRAAFCPGWWRPAVEWAVSTSSRPMTPGAALQRVRGTAPASTGIGAALAAKASRRRELHRRARRWTAD